MTSRPGDIPSPRLQRWLDWDRRRFPLGLGTHLVGRDADAGIRIDASTVSRHHARIIVWAAEVVLEDLASKNGTFRGDDRVTGRVTLADGDQLRFGDVQVVFHSASADASTATRAVASTRRLK